MFTDYEREKQLREIDEFLDELKEENPKTRLFEHLEKSELKKLDAYLEKHKDVKNILLVPAKELKNTKYKYLGIVPDMQENANLYDLMKISIQNYGKIKSYFSVDDENNIKGFVGLILSGDEIADIKMFSFNLEKFNITLAKDLITLIPELLEKYKAINWSAMKENPINKAYKKIIHEYDSKKEFNGKIREYKDPDSNIECIRYRIEKN